MIDLWLDARSDGAWVDVHVERLLTAPLLAVS